MWEGEMLPSLGGSERCGVCLQMWGVPAGVDAHVEAVWLRRQV